MKINSNNTLQHDPRFLNSKNFQSPLISIIEAPSFAKKLKNKRLTSKSIDFGSTKEALNLDLTKLDYDSFGYEKDDHFLDFLNKKSSKWEVIFRQLYPEDSRRKTRLYSEVIDPKIADTLKLKSKFAKKFKKFSRRRSKHARPFRRRTSSNLAKRAESTNTINKLSNSNKNSSLCTVRSKTSINGNRSNSSNGSLIKIPGIKINNDENNESNTVRLKETDSLKVKTPKETFDIPKPNRVSDDSKFRKQSPTSQLEELITSQKSILDGIANINKQSIMNDFVKDKYKNPSIAKAKLEKSEGGSSKSNDNDSSQARYSVLNVRERK